MLDVWSSPRRLAIAYLDATILRDWAMMAKLLHPKDLAKMQQQLVKVAKKMSRKDEKNGAASFLKFFPKARHPDDIAEMTAEDFYTQFITSLWGQAGLNEVMVPRPIVSEAELSSPKAGSIAYKFSDIEYDFGAPVHLPKPPPDGILPIKRNDDRWYVLLKPGFNQRLAKMVADA